MTKLCKNDFSRVARVHPGQWLLSLNPSRQGKSFYIFEQFWESLGIREISKKLTIFAIVSVTKVRFFLTLHCAFLELLLELKHFSKKDIIKSDVELKEPKNLRNPQSVAEPTYF